LFQLTSIVLQSSQLCLFLIDNDYRCFVQ